MARCIDAAVDHAVGIWAFKSEGFMSSLAAVERAADSTRFLRREAKPLSLPPPYLPPLRNTADQRAAM
jgi:hypothetical protein